MRLTLDLTAKQLQFLRCGADEVLFGGAAGGGKSFAQMLDALVYALRYPGSRQLLLRRSRPELERTLVQTALRLYPAALYRYSAAAHRGQFANGSVLEFGYLSGEGDLGQYQSAEYDMLRFDELTHFSEQEYLYMRSRLRGANRFPKQVKSCSNPGGRGHSWVKARFIDSMPPGCCTEFAGGSRIFLPARVEDNCFLMALDPDYRKRLASLPPRERRALLEGRWDLAEGRFFPEFSRQIHVVAPRALPMDTRHVLALDYGLDRLAALWFALLPDGGILCYRELCESSLVISQAAQRILDACSEPLWAAFAPADLWNRRQETGRSAADLFAAQGLELTRVQASRTRGWLALKELLLPAGQRAGAAGPLAGAAAEPPPLSEDEMLPGAGEAGGEIGVPRLQIVSGCRELIRCLEEIGCDARDPCDAATVPHYLTHAPDAARYFAVGLAGLECREEAAPPPDALQELFRFGT